MVASAASARTPLDPGYRVSSNQFLAGINLGYNLPSKAGITDGTFFGPTAQTLNYGVMDQLFVFYEPSSISRPAIGFNWQLSSNRRFGMDLIAKYELSADNIVPTIGTYIYGDVSDKFSWGFNVAARFVDRDYYSDWLEYDLLMNLQGLYKLGKTWAIRGDIFYNISAHDHYMDLPSRKDGILYQRKPSARIGAVYNVNKSVDIMPYIARSFDTQNTYKGGNWETANSVWTIGTQFGVQF
jgi:hypothetical protein